MIKLEDLEMYKIAMDFGDVIWGIAEKLPNFAKYSTGTQLVNAADSVAANISEGYGRYHYRDKVNFFYYSRGSLFETKTWLRKLRKRNLIEQDIMDELQKSIDSLHLKLNSYIKKTKEQYGS